MKEPLLDPTGASERSSDTSLAPRPHGLRGLTVGLLDNTKPNAAVLLHAIGRELKGRYGVKEVRMFTKGYFGTPVEESVVQQILHNCDFAVAGVGDWGSCSAASLADGIVLERAGVPAVSVCTDAFRITAEAMADSLGFPGYQYVAVPHPIASRTEQQIDEMVREAMPELLRILGGGVQGWSEGDRR